MAGFWEWLIIDWFNLVQSFCLVGGFIFASKAWRLQFLVGVTEKHRNLWEKMMNDPNVQRIFTAQVNLSEKPITQAEKVALDMILIHYETGWETARFLDRERLKPLANDIGRFFRLPLVHHTWDKTKDCHSRNFVRFVDQAIKTSGQAPW
jgi:hypothetical protein